MGPSFVPVKHFRWIQERYRRRGNIVKGFDEGDVEIEVLVTLGGLFGGCAEGSDASDRSVIRLPRVGKRRMRAAIGPRSAVIRAM